MTKMTADLYKAILSMDAYNRSYGMSIDFRKKDANGEYINNSDDTIGLKVGNAEIYAKRGQLDAQSIGFYGIAYQLSSGERVISYRGTDDFKTASDIISSKDFNNGYSIGIGDGINSPQGNMAIEF